MLVFKKFMVLVILDGYGYCEEQQDNVIFSVKILVMDVLWVNCLYILIDVFGLEVGLFDCQMGNFEVGYVNLGVGCIVYQDLICLDVEIKDCVFFVNLVLIGVVDKVKNVGKVVYIMGLFFVGGVYSYEDYIMVMVELVVECGVEKIYLYVFFDGCDILLCSVEFLLKKFEEKFVVLGKGCVVFIIGCYYVMDCDNCWDCVEKVYDLLILVQGEFQVDIVVVGLQVVYVCDENDEFVKVIVICVEGQLDVVMEDGDVLIFMNFCVDCVCEIICVFVNVDFDGFVCKKVVNVDFVMLIEYVVDIKIVVVYLFVFLVNIFGEWMVKNDKIQLCIFEIEKYVYVIFFFNGGVEELFKGEDCILINLLKVVIYDL